MFFQPVKMAWDSVISSKMRSFLTMLGIIVGVIALVVLVSIANGTTSQVTDVISSMGTNMLTVSIDSDTDDPVALSDMDELRELSHISLASPVASDNLTAGYGSDSDSAQITGTDGSYLDIEGETLSAGRNLLQSDMDNHTYVAVINEDIASDLLGVTNTADAVGMQFKLDGTPFTVIGVIAANESVTNSRTSYEAIIPYTTLMRLSSSVSSVTSIVVSAASDDEMDAAEQALEGWLYERFGDEDLYSVINMSTVADSMADVTNTLPIMLGGIASISLLVGGIGIMNIMLVSVTERTREIGIRKAIGAGNGSIMAQFLVEALMLSLMGCGAGIGASWGILKIIDKVAGYSYTMDRTVCLLAVGFSLLIGLVFGIYPAGRAAKKRPIEALHYSG